MKDFKTLIDKGGHIKRKEIEDIYKRLKCIVEVKKDISKSAGGRANIISTSGGNIVFVDKKCDIDTSSTEIVKSDKESALPIWKGLFGGSTSVHGYTIDVLKSAMQKYCRRRMMKDMIWCVNELDNFSLIPDGKGETVRTNMLNRLKIILCEDLVFSDYKTFIYCIDSLNKWNTEGRNDQTLLHKVCIAITQGKLCRLCSDIKAYWKDRILLDKKSCDKYEEMVKSMSIRIESKKDDPVVCKYIELLKSCFDRHSEECFYWFFKIMEKADEKVKGKIRFKKHGCEYIFWEWIYGFAVNNPLLKRIFDELQEIFHERRKERYIFALNALCLVFYKIKLDDKLLPEVPYILDDYESLNRTKLMIHDFCIDMHCSEGKRKGKNKTTFALEGSLVIDEDKEFYREDWRCVYHELKGVKKGGKDEEKI